MNENEILDRESEYEIQSPIRILTDYNLNITSCQYKETDTHIEGIDVNDERFFISKSIIKLCRQIPMEHFNLLNSKMKRERQVKRNNENEKQNNTTYG